MGVQQEQRPVLRLASASPRRRQLLELIGVPHLVTPADIDETPRPGEAGADYVTRLARDKAVARHAGQRNRRGRGQPAQQPGPRTKNTTTSAATDSDQSTLMVCGETLAALQRITENVSCSA